MGHQALVSVAHSAVSLGGPSGVGKMGHRDQRLVAHLALRDLLLCFRSAIAKPSVQMLCNLVAFEPTRNSAILTRRRSRGPC